MKKLTVIGCGIALLLLSCKAKDNNKTVASSPVELKSKSTGNAKADEVNGIIAAYNSNTNQDSIATTSASPVVLQSAVPPVIDWNKKIIKTANVSLELKDYKSFNNYIHQNIKNYGGYIATEQQLQSETQINNSITLKVPAEKFEQLLNDVSDKDVKVTQKQISSEDVTGEFIDTKGRIEARKMLRAKYNEFMKSAKNMEEALQVQQEINTITEDLESANQRINYISHESSYSTINLSYTQYFNGATPVEKPDGFFAKLGNAFKSGGAFIGQVLVVAVALWPAVLAILIAWFIYKRYGKDNKVTVKS